MLIRAADRQRRVSARRDVVAAARACSCMLRDGLGLPGSKNACEQGECGSCSVWLDGELVCSCLVLAAQADGADVRTVEALADDGAPASCAGGVPRRGRGAVRVLHARDDRRRGRPARARSGPRRAAIREALSGNLCRCTGYAKIVAAVHLAAEELS